MLRVYVGAVLIIAGIAGFIEANTHRPETFHEFGGKNVLGVLTLTSKGTAAWSQTAYDFVRIGASASIILGTVTVALDFFHERYRARPG